MHVPQSPASHEYGGDRPTRRAQFNNVSPGSRRAVVSFRKRMNVTSPPGSGVDVSGFAADSCSVDRMSCVTSMRPSAPQICSSSVGDRHRSLTGPDAVPAGVPGAASGPARAARRITNQCLVYCSMRVDTAAHRKSRRRRMDVRPAPLGSEGMGPNAARESPNQDLSVKGSVGEPIRPEVDL
jgi:hypothetical protein